MDAAEQCRCSETLQTCLNTLLEVPFFSNLISNLPNEALTIFRHELVSWLFMDLLLHNLW